MNNRLFVAITLFMIASFSVAGCATNNTTNQTTTANLVSSTDETQIHSSRGVT